MKGKEKPTSGSIKIDTEVYQRVWEYCERTGLKITRFATEAMRDRLQLVENQEQPELKNKE